MPTGKPEHIQPSMALYFTEERPSKLPYMIRLGRQDIDIPAGEREYTSTDSYVLPVDVDAVAVQPHAHRLAKDIRGMATLPDGTSQWLIDIKDWDMRWQDVYRYRRPISLPKGTTLTMRYTYDNSSGNIRNSSNPPKRVTFGQTSSSEMGDLWIQVMPRSDADRRRLDADFAPKMLREDIAGIEKMLEIDASDPRLHTDLGLCYLEAKKPAAALAHLEEAARLQPASAGAQYDVGMVHLQERRFGEARRYFTEAVRLKPEFAGGLHQPWCGQPCRRQGHRSGRLVFARAPDFCREPGGRIQPRSRARVPRKHRCGPGALPPCARSQAG